MEGGVVSMSWLGRCWGRMEKMVGRRHVSKPSASRKAGACSSPWKLNQTDGMD